MADEQAIQEAQKEIDDYNTQKAIDAIDDEIKAWQDYKKTWDNIPSDFEKMQNALIAQEILGKDAEADILNKRIDTFNDFKAGYLQILQDIEDATKRSNEKIKELNLEATTNYVPDTSGSGGSGGGYGGGGYGGGGNTSGSTTVAKPANPYNFVEFKKDPFLKGYWLEEASLIKGTRGNYVAQKGVRFYNYDTSKNTMTVAGLLKQQHQYDRDAVNKKYVPLSNVYRNAPTQGGMNTLQTRASGSPFINRSGIYNINENGAELGIHNPARGSYTFLTHGDGILNAGLTRNIMALAQNPELAIRNVLGHILASGNNTTTNAQSQIITIQNVNLPNVNNATQFVKQLQLISQNH